MKKLKQNTNKKEKSSDYRKELMKTIWNTEDFLCKII